VEIVGEYCPVVNELDSVEHLSQALFIGENRIDLQGMETEE
jgi:hypothetical protein